MADVIGGPQPTPADLEAAASAVVGEGWGRHPSRVRRVSSDVEETFLVAFDGPFADRAVLKIAEPGRDPEWFAFEAAIVEQALHGDPALPLARGIPTPEGAALATVRFLGAPRIARLMHHLPGVSSVEASPTAADRRRIGRVAGRVSRALAPIDHPMAARVVPWDLRGLDGLADAIDLVPHAAARSAVHQALAAHPALLRTASALPAQLSHNDLNGGNVLVSPADAGEVTGIIDFGDAARTPRVFDLAIGAAYAAAEAAAAGSAPWEAAASFAAGYSDEVDLVGDEIALVPALARARLAQRVLIAAARARATSGTPTRDNDAWLVAAQRDLCAIAEASPSDAPDAPREWR